MANDGVATNEAEVDVVEDGTNEMHENVDALRSTGETVAKATASSGNEREYTDTERKALKMGWNPDKDSVPEGKEWVDAGEFVRKDTLYKEIRNNYIWNPT